MSQKVSSLATLAITALILATPAMGGEAPPWVKIKKISYAGSGCPAGSVVEDLSPDRKAFTLLFDSYVAEAGPGVPTREQRKNCQVNVVLDFPSGWSFTIADIDYRGYVYLDKKVEGVQKASYYFQGQGKTADLETTFVGPKDGDFHIRDTLGLSAQVWSPCGASRSLNINSQVRINNTRNKNGVGLLTTDSIDGQLTHIYGLLWRRC